ncbi:helix-turn-helix domain-containing protein [Bacillus sp. SCS-151]|uniref:helix-turn-helix domain-containing protein n=1 Tax=Nanhaiella sioensis TaxID=3115293 RepID=UPI00397C01FC
MENRKDTETFSFSDIVPIPVEYTVIDQPKRHIANMIKDSIDKNGLTVRKLGEKIDGMSYSQISRVTTKQNYNIDTLLKILDALDLEIQIKYRNPK